MPELGDRSEDRLRHRTGGVGRGGAPSRDRNADFDSTAYRGTLLRGRARPAGTQPARPGTPPPGARAPRGRSWCAFYRRLGSTTPPQSPDIVPFMLGFMVALTLLGSSQSEPPVGPGRGVSEALARERAAAIRDLKYDLAFTIPVDRQAPVRGRAVVHLVLDAPRELVFDFAQPADRLLAVRAGGRSLPPAVVDGHIVVPAGMTAAGANRDRIRVHGRRRSPQPQRRVSLHAVRPRAGAAGVPLLRPAGSEGPLHACR